MATAAEQTWQKPNPTEPLRALGPQEGDPGCRPPVLSPPRPPDGHRAVPMWVWGGRARTPAEAPARLTVGGDPHTGRCFTTRGNSSAGHTPHCALSQGSRPQEGVRDPGPPWLSRAGDLWGSLALRLQTQLTWGGSESVATAPARGLTAFPGRAGNAGAAAGRRGHSEPPQLGDQASCVHLTCGGTALLLSPLQAQSRDPG